MLENANSPGKLLVIEGPDGVGKSTLAAEIAKRFATTTSVALHSFPGRKPGTLGQWVYDAYHAAGGDGGISPSPLAMQALHVAAHIDSIESLILPSMAAGQTIILDRFWWSTLVYGRAAGCKAESLRALIEAEETVWAGAAPTLVVLLKRLVPFGADLASENWSLLQRLYDETALAEASQYQVITMDSDASVGQLAENVIARFTEIQAEDRGKVL